jgi:branched-chain amino acid transport system ATP-binding protein
MEILKVSGLTKSFGGLTAIEKLSFDVEEGRIFGIIGPNGSGKTTLFNLIHGFYQPTQGDIVFQGKSVVGKKIHQVADSGIGRTFQTTTVFQQRTVYENIFLASAGESFHFLTSIFWRSNKFRQAFSGHLEDTDRVLKLIELETLRDELAGNMSQEAQKRVAIGMALATHPKLLLLDEPTGGIPIEETEGVVNLIRKIQNLGITICLIEHKMKVVMNLAERILVLNYGRKIAEGNPQEVRSNQEVIKAYLGEDYAITEGY